MKLKHCFPTLALALITVGCSVYKNGSREENSHTTVAPEIVSYNELTMTLDDRAVTYTIDVSTPEGQLKLNKISLADAQQLALVECLMKYNCATLFNPQYTHLKKGKNILRVTVYGFPARYKRAEPEQITQSEQVVETRRDTVGSVTRQTRTTRQTSPRRPQHSKTKTKR